MNILFTVIFVLGVYYLLQYRLNLKKAIVISKDSLYPKTESEFGSILLPTDWKGMEPITKNTKSYQYVKWGTLVALVLLTTLLVIVIATDWLGISVFSFAYFFFGIINAIKHRGNLFILPKGVILNGYYYSSNQIRCYETERIIRWHELYGYDSRVNNAYKLTIKVKKKLSQPNYFVVKDHHYLEQMMDLLNEQGIPGIQKMGEPQSSDGKVTNKF